VETSTVHYVLEIKNSNENRVTILSSEKQPTGSLWKEVLERIELCARDLEFSGRKELGTYRASLKSDSYYKTKRKYTFISSRLCFVIY
jgi:hypothetical protein